MALKNSLMFLQKIYMCVFFKSYLKNFSQQQHLADYKMKQNLNRVKNSQSTPSRSGTEDNFSPSILGSLGIKT